MLKTWIKTCVIAGAVTFGMSSVADLIKVKGIAYPNVRVMNIKNGKLYVELAGRQRDFDIELVEALEIERYPKLADADRAIQRKKFDEAVDLLEELSGSVREKYLQFWVNAKATYCLDQLGRFDEAFTYYQKVLTYDQGLLVKSIAPKKYPKSKEDKEEILKAVMRYALDAPNDDAKAIAKLMVKNIEASIAGKEVKPADSTNTTSSNAFVGNANAKKADPIQKLIDAKKYKEAAAEIEKAFKKERAPLIKLFMQQASVYAATGKSKDAAVSYMRVVVHFPRAAEVAECLVGAGDMMLKLKVPDQARKLWEEAEGLVSDEDKLSGEIAKRLSALKK